jgi:hypothetical protein
MTAGNLAHFGVKGMKWGVRKQRELEGNQRIASGKATRLQRTAFRLNTPILELLANKGDIQKIAKGKAFMLQAQKERIESGNATGADRVDRALNTPIIDLIRGR